MYTRRSPPPPRLGTRLASHLLYLRWEHSHIQCNWSVEVHGHAHGYIVDDVTASIYIDKAIVQLLLDTHELLSGNVATHACTKPRYSITVLHAWAKVLECCYMILQVNLLILFQFAVCQLYQFSQISYCNLVSEKRINSKLVRFMHVISVLWCTKTASYLEIQQSKYIQTCLAAAVLCCWSRL